MSIKTLWEAWLSLRDRETVILEPFVVTCDIDGVLSDCTERYETLYRDRDKPGWRPDWDAFHGPAMDEEPCHKEYVLLLQLLQRANARIYLLTNRTEDLRSRTAKWCYYNDVPYDTLLMRDFDQPFPTAKAVHLDHLIARHERPALGIDDDPAEEKTYLERNIPFLYVHRGHHVGEIGNG